MATLITNVLSYTGPGVLSVLLAAKNKVFCHDPAFVSQINVQEFEKLNYGAIALTSQTPTDIADELKSIGAELNSVVHNDVHPNNPMPIKQIPMSMFSESIEKLLLFPIQLTQELLPELEKSGGSIVFVTSARPLKPEVGFAVATTVRSAATNFALALAKEVANDGIQVNVIAPNFLSSEAYYPKSKYVDDPAGREVIRSSVPMGRLGKPEEIGELVAFLISGKSNFVTGQVIHFTGGWP